MVRKVAANVEVEGRALIRQALKERELQYEDWRRKNIAAKLVLSSRELKINTD